MLNGNQTCHCIELFVITNNINESFSTHVYYIYICTGPYMRCIILYNTHSNNNIIIYIYTHTCTAGITCTGGQILKWRALPWL